jgi:O-acetyl-ADP-ribose deacetylase (regulator of RNase III)
MTTRKAPYLTDWFYRGLMTIEIHLRDLNKDVVSSWRDEFAGEPRVQVSHGDILSVAADAIVSPGNSFGLMDGGIELIYADFFGGKPLEHLNKILRERHFGELPVGHAVVVPTGHHAIPFLVSAPVARVPRIISETVNVYLAFRAALIAVLAHNKDGRPPVRSLLAPGLGTGAGQMPPRRAARQMRMAYDAIIKGQPLRNRVGIWREHDELLA